MPLLPTGQMVDEFGNPMDPRAGGPLDFGVAAPPQDPGGFVQRFQAPPIPGRFTPQSPEVQQTYEQARRPPAWGPGRIASTIIGAPFQMLHGLDQELKGVLGIPTLEDYAAPGRSLYSSDRSESRAFGTSSADEPEFGDRFTGAITGQTRRDLNAYFRAANLIRQQNQERRFSLKETKDVADLQQKALAGFKSQLDAEKEARFGEQQELLELARKQAAINSSQTSQYLNQIRIREKQDREARMEELIRRLRRPDGGGVEIPLNEADISRVIEGGEDLGLARELPFLLDLASKGNALEASERDRQAIEGARPMVGGLDPSAAKVAGEAASGLRRVEELHANPIDPDAGKTRSELTSREWEMQAAEEAQLQREIDNIMSLYAGREKGLKGDWYNFGPIGESREDRVAALTKERGDLIAMLQGGKVSREDAARVAGGSLPFADLMKQAPEEDLQASAEEEKRLRQEFDAYWTAREGFRPSKESPTYKKKMQRFLSDSDWRERIRTEMMR